MFGSPVLQRTCCVRLVVEIDGEEVRDIRVARRDELEIAYPVGLRVRLLVVHQVIVRRIGHEPRRVLLNLRHAVEVEHDVHAFAIRFRHPQVEHLEGCLAEQFRVQVRVDVTQLVDGRLVVERIRNEGHTNGVESEALHLCNLLFPPHLPQVLRLEYRRVEAEMADTLDLKLLPVRTIDLAVPNVVPCRARSGADPNEEYSDQQRLKRASPA
jgi:hypothetical protein